MKLTINLKHPEFCDDCPCVGSTTDHEVGWIISNPVCNFNKKYKVKYMPLLTFHKPTYGGCLLRPPKCIKDNDK